MSSEILLVPLILLLVVVAPLWIVFHYISKMRAAQSLSSDEQDLLLELRNLADRLENRIETIERILDADKDGWRNEP